MAMPETPMHEKHCAVPRQHQIRLSDKVPLMQSEPESGLVEEPTKYALGGRVRSADSRHHAAPHCGWNNISQCASFAELADENVGAKGMAAASRYTALHADTSNALEVSERRSDIK